MQKLLDIWNRSIIFIHLFLSVSYVDKTCFLCFYVFLFCVLNASNIYIKKYCLFNLTYNTTCDAAAELTPLLNLFPLKFLLLIIFDPPVFSCKAQSCFILTIFVYALKRSKKFLYLILYNTVNIKMWLKQNQSLIKQVIYATKS